MGGCHSKLPLKKEEVPSFYSIINTNPQFLFFPLKEIDLAYLTGNLSPLVTSFVASKIVSNQKLSSSRLGECSIMGFLKR